MAKAFSKAFYHSKEWERVRQAALLRDNGMCQAEGCNRPAEEVHHIVPLTLYNIHDPDITLNLDRLVSLCRDCHFREHRKMIAQKFERRERVLDKDGYWFDEDGMMRQMEVYLVWGAPASGKTTYVQEHRESSDLVIDLDKIRWALGGGRNLLELCLSVRDHLYQLIADRDQTVDCRHVWVIATLPRKKERRELVERLRAKEIHMDAGLEECKARAFADSRSGNTQARVAAIEKFFERLEM